MTKGIFLGITQQVIFKSMNKACPFFGAYLLNHIFTSAHVSTFNVCQDFILKVYMHAYSNVTLLTVGCVIGEQLGMEWQCTEQSWWICL